MFKCGRCEVGGQDLSDVITHIEDAHPNEELKYKKWVLSHITGIHGWQSYLIPVIPKIAQNENKIITVDEHSGSINLLQRTISPDESPATKKIQN